MNISFSIKLGKETKLFPVFLMLFGNKTDLQVKFSLSLKVNYNIFIDFYFLLINLHGAYIIYYLYHLEDSIDNFVFKVFGWLKENQLRKEKTIITYSPSKVISNIFAN